MSIGPIGSVILPQPPALLQVLEAQLEVVATALPVLVRKPMVVDTELNGWLFGEEASVGPHSSVHEDPLSLQPEFRSGSLG